MGDVLSIIKVMPTGPDVDMGKLAEDIEGLSDIHAIVEKPVAFGIKCLEVQVIKADSKGGTDALEEEIRGLEGVESAEVTGLTLL